MALKYIADARKPLRSAPRTWLTPPGIPAQLLAEILQQLTKAGLLRSHAGMNGGYALVMWFRVGLGPAPSVDFDRLQG